MASGEEVFAEAFKIVCDLVEEEVLKSDESPKKQRKRSKRKVWVKPWIARRKDLGFSATFLSETRIEDPKTYRNFLRMSPEKFDELLELVRPYITKSDTFFRDAIPAKVKLEVVLAYLATGCSFGTLEACFRVAVSTISDFLVPVLQSISKVLKQYMKVIYYTSLIKKTLQYQIKFQVPSTAEEWDAVSNGFHEKWNFPNCCGALDGKHIRVQKPPCSNSNFINYKSYFSTVLFALVDSNYKFIFADIGKNGRCNDASIYRDCSLRKGIEDGTLNFPKDAVLVGDDAFPLSNYLMKPYSHHGLLTDDETIFNYRLSRARRVVENAFGIMVSRFRIFTRPIDLIPEKADEIVKGTCSLHNWLRETSPNTYFPFGCVDHEDFKSGDTIPGNITCKQI